MEAMLRQMIGPQINLSMSLAAKLHVARPETGVLFVSGYTSHAVVRGGMLREGTDFLQKPFTPTDLAATVRTILDRRA